MGKTFFSNNTYFREGTRAFSLDETIPIKYVEPVVSKKLKFASAELLNSSNDYFGNTLMRVKDQFGNEKNITIYKGRNQPRGIDGNVKWGMKVQQFKKTKAKPQKNIPLRFYWIGEKLKVITET